MNTSLEIPDLSLGTSSFSALRESGMIYVDKSRLIYDLARRKGNFLMTRPRRFGKSLLISTFESLFKQELEFFKDLEIADLWTDGRKYDVVRLDFSLIKPKGRSKSFPEVLEEYLTAEFSSIGFEPSGKSSLLEDLGLFLRSKAPSSVVLLIDEYDAPLTASMFDAPLFKTVRDSLAIFYSLLQSNASVFRFLFLTGIAKFDNGTLFPGWEDLEDISLDPTFGSLLGFTRKELAGYFDPYLDKAALALNLGKAELIDKLLLNYGGFCFERTVEKKVAAPWSILSFLDAPSRGLKNYWFASGANPFSFLQNFPSSSLLNPESFGKLLPILLKRLKGDGEPCSQFDVAVMTQAGYLTLKELKEDTAFVNYPNEEIQTSMARLYARKLLNGLTPGQVGADNIPQALSTESPEAVFHLLNLLFEATDYQNYPVIDEASVLTFARIFLAGATLRPKVVTASNGKRVLEVAAGERLWRLMFLFCRRGGNPEEKLREGISEMQCQNRNFQNSLILMRMVMVFSEQDRKFVKWKCLE